MVQSVPSRSVLPHYWCLNSESFSVYKESNMISCGFNLLLCYWRQMLITRGLFQKAGSANAELKKKLSWSQWTLWKETLEFSVSDQGFRVGSVNSECVDSDLLQVYTERRPQWSSIIHHGNVRYPTLRFSGKGKDKLMWHRVQSG